MPAVGIRIIIVMPPRRSGTPALRRGDAVAKS
jgi:hypothetical protein